MDKDKLEGCMYSVKSLHSLSNVKLFYLSKSSFLIVLINSLKNPKQSILVTKLAELHALPFRDVWKLTLSASFYSSDVMKKLIDSTL